MSKITKNTELVVNFNFSEPFQKQWEETLRGDNASRFSNGSNFSNGEEIDSVKADLVDGSSVFVRMIEAEPSPYIEVLLFDPDGDSHHSIPVESLGTSIEFGFASISYIINI